MKVRTITLALVVATVGLMSFIHKAAADTGALASGKIKHVLLISIDGMHAVDFYNCANGVAGVNYGSPYCPNLALLAQTGINYVGTVSSKPSDSFPGMAALAVRPNRREFIMTWRMTARSIRRKSRPAQDWREVRAPLTRCRMARRPTTIKALRLTIRS